MHCLEQAQALGASRTVPEDTSLPGQHLLELDSSADLLSQEFTTHSGHVGTAFHVKAHVRSTFLLLSLIYVVS